MLNYTNFWPAIGLTVGVGLLVTAALCLLIATFSPDWLRPGRRPQPAVTPAEPAVRDHQNHQNRQNRRNHGDQKAA